MNISNKKNMIIDSILSTLVGGTLYLITIFALPAITISSTVDVIIFALCFIFGGMIYSLLKNKYKKRL